MAAILCGLPLAVRATPVGTWQLVTAGPGDKADPAIDAQTVLYSTNAAGSRDVVEWLIGAAPEVVTSLAGGAGDQDQPSLHRNTYAYRDSTAGIWVKDLYTGTVLRDPNAPAVTAQGRRCRPADPVDHPVVSDVLAAWVCGSTGSRSVVVARIGAPPEEYELSGAGDVFGASVYGALVAYVDASDGTVWLHDSTPASRLTSRVCGGVATGVSVSADLGVPVIAVTRASTGADADVEVWDPTGGLGTAGRVAALLVPGEQRNPRLSNDWVALEDLSTGVSQVVLWQWTTGLVFAPHPSTSNQTLSDLSVVTSSMVRVVWADDVDGTGVRREIALYQLPASIPQDATPTPWPWPCPAIEPPPSPASCDGTYPNDVDPCACRDDDDGDHHRGGRDDGSVRSEHALRDDDACRWTSNAICTADRAHRTPVVLARLDLERDDGQPPPASRAFDATPCPGDAVLPVLVCVDLEHVAAGWLTLDDDLLAGPSSFKLGVHHLEWQRAVSRPTGRIVAAIASKPGATLVARVIADPGSAPQAVAGCTTGTVIVPGGRIAGPGTSGSRSPGSGTSASGGAGATSGAPGGSSHRGSGCGTPGGTGALGGLVLVVLLRLRRRAAAATE